MVYAACPRNPFHSILEPMLSVFLRTGDEISPGRYRPTSRTMIAKELSIQGVQQQTSPSPVTRHTTVPVPVHDSELLSRFGSHSKGLCKTRASPSGLPPATKQSTLIEISRSQTSAHEHIRRPALPWLPGDGYPTASARNTKEQSQPFAFGVTLRIIQGCLRLRVAEGPNSPVSLRSPSVGILVDAALHKFFARERFALE